MRNSAVARKTKVQNDSRGLATLDMNTGPTISVIVPCRNELRFIGTCIDSLFASNYPSDRMEIIVVNGMSDDGTREEVASLVRRNQTVHLLDNPKRTMPAGVNLGIQHAKGELIFILGAHARVDSSYFSRCVDSLLAYGADNVGGIIETIPQTDGLMGRAIVHSLSHRFGVGNSYFRIHSDQPRWVDTVFGGCYRKRIFEEVGPFNELLTCSQDMEFNRRLKKRGGKILLMPDIICYYYARSNLSSFWRHNFRNGVWAILPFLYSEVMPVRFRHLVPLLFVTSVFGSALASMQVRPFWWLLLTIVGSYCVCSVLASLQIAWRRQDVRYLFLMPLVFSMLHLGYGLGSAWGMVRVLQAGLARAVSANRSSAGA
jgi:cellulose synthase/poly-beta-1,6-N-acetylglucosamine synthase-like glycosyltransferase